jgi:hypothetical protein
MRFFHSLKLIFLGLVLQRFSATLVEAPKAEARRSQKKSPSSFGNGSRTRRSKG